MVLVGEFSGEAPEIAVWLTIADDADIERSVTDHVQRTADGVQGPLALVAEGAATEKGQALACS